MITRHVLIAGLALVLGLSGSLGATRPAAAQKGSLPTIKIPTSERVTLDGTITLQGQAFTVKGSGQHDAAQFGADAQLSGPHVPAAVTVHLRQVKKVAYLYLPGQSDAAAIDLAPLPPEAANIVSPVPGAGAFDPGAAARMLAHLTQVQALGAETDADGRATTKYQGVVDLPGLIGGSDAAVPAEQRLPADARLLATAWIGDKDQYVHQLHLALAVTVPDRPGGPGAPLVEDLTLRFSDFNEPVAVEAPAASKPFNLGNAEIQGGLIRVAGFPAMLVALLPAGEATAAPRPAEPGPGTVISSEGSSASAPPAVVSAAGSSASAPPATRDGDPQQMPPTGAADPAGAVALLALGLLCLLAGWRLRWVAA